MTWSRCNWLLLVETDEDTGIFKGDFQIPANTVQELMAHKHPAQLLVDLEVNYVDYRDASGEIIEVGDGAGIRANTGSISLDRTVYPVPFGGSDFAAEVNNDLQKVMHSSQSMQTGIDGPW